MLDSGVGDLNCTQNVVAGRETGRYGRIKPAIKKKNIGNRRRAGGLESARVAL